MSSRDPETGCALIILVCAAVVIAFDLLIGALIDWRLPILWHVGSVIVVIAVLIKLDVDEWRTRRRR